MGFENGRLVRAVFRATTGTDQQVMTLHYDLDDASSTPNDPQQLADTLRDAVRPFVIARYTNSWTIDPVLVVEEIDPLNPLDPRSSWTSGAALPGTKALSSQLLPRGLCALAALKSANLGRRFNGRIFFGGSWAEGDNLDGNVESNWRGFLLNELNAIPKQPDIATGVSLATAKWCIYSRTQRAANLNPYAVPVASYIVRTPFHYLRSRAQL